MCGLRSTKGEYCHQDYLPVEVEQGPPKLFEQHTNEGSVKTCMTSVKKSKTILKIPFHFGCESFLQLT